MSIEDILSDMPFTDDLSQPLMDERAADVLEHLERAVNRYRFDQPKRSVELANLFIQVGTLRRSECEIALGTMLLADSLWQSGVAHYQTAWDKLGEAAARFESCSDGVGWARTRIGRLAICYDLGRAADAFADVEKAERIFQEAERFDKLLTLRANTAFVYNYQGKYEEALRILQQAFDQAQAMGEKGEGYIAALYRSMGYSHSYLGNLDAAQACYQRAYEHDLPKNWRLGAATSRISLSYLARAHGNYQEALRLLLNLDFLSGDTSHLMLQFKLTHAELDLELNRYESARELAQASSVEAAGVDNYRYQACALMLLGNALVGLRKYAQAGAAFAQAEVLFETLGSTTWLALAWLQKGLMALKQGDVTAARQAIDAAAARFNADQRRIDLTQARLLQVETRLQSGDLTSASEFASQAVLLAEEVNVPALKYHSHYLLGRIAEAQGRTQLAVNEYRAACETIWHIQRALTITLRPDFMVDKHDAAHAMIRLLLAEGEVGQAFEVIEQMKAQIVLNEFANRSNLRWQVHDERIRTMVNALDRLRAQHNYVYRVLNPSPVERGLKDPKLTSDQHARLIAENAAREREMQRLTEQLYLEAAIAGHHQLIDLPDLASIRRALPLSTALLAYYDDGQALWGFVITHDHEIQAHRLPTTVEHYTFLLNCLYDKMDFALDLRDDPDMLEQLTLDTQEILRDMDEVVMTPLRKTLSAYDKLIIVPYGPLHYVPFSALYDGQQYLTQRYDVTILPAASLVMRETPQHETLRARVIGHSWNGYLPSVIDEAEMVHELCEGDLYIESDANVSALAGEACKILHICAHGEFRIDRPEISFIQLDDCQLYTDDLLQNDMHYQLVVLSSCETGRADIAPGDELIGLGRGFLYAGAGAVLTTLWRIESNHALSLMKTFYEYLLEGYTTDKALRLAQIALLSNVDSQHPVFWAPFQLTGTAEALVSVETL